MQQLILKNNISPLKMEALISLFKAWNIEAEIKTGFPILDKKKNAFSLSVGLWKDNVIDAKTLRKQAWNRNA